MQIRVPPKALRVKIQTSTTSALVEGHAVAANVNSTRLVNKFNPFRMPTMLLSARQTGDAQLLWRACIALNWQVVRVHGWRVPEIETKDVAVYGEPLFASHVAQTLHLQLQEPPIDWLPKLEPQWRGREVRLRPWRRRGRWLCERSSSRRMRNVLMPEFIRVAPNCRLPGRCPRTCPCSFRKS